MGRKWGVPKRWSDATLIALLALGLYWVTLAPTVLWGDSGHLQLQAVKGVLQASAGSHPLWVWIAHQFARIPVGDVAARVNLVSALFAALTVGLLYLILREGGLGREPAALAVLAFGISHTFWSTAVCAEVYSLTLALMATLVWLGLRWYHTGGVCYLAWAGLVAGLGLAAHLMVVLYAPALVWLACRRRKRLTGLGLAVFAAGLMIGLLPLGLLLMRDARTMALSGREALRWALFTFEGYDFGGELFDFSLRLLPSDTLQWLVFLGLQFVGLAAGCGVIGAVSVWKAAERDLAAFLALLYVGSMAFAFAYRVGDRYVFYLPSYIPFAAWIGYGVTWGLGRLRRMELSPRAEGWVGAATAALLLGVPVGAYRLAPRLVSQGITIRDARRVPGPNSSYFFLWPAKAGYDDARAFAIAALDAAPDRAVLLADPTLASPMQFLQEVEGLRPDVTVRYCCWDIEGALAEAGERPVALGDLAAEIYPVAWLEQEYQLSPRGPIHVLEKRVP